MAMFRTPEEVAPELGMTKAELRRYCKESGNYTLLSRRRVMLDEENIAGLIAWVKAKGPRPVDPAAIDLPEVDNFQ